MVRYRAGAMGADSTDTADGYATRIVEMGEAGMSALTGTHGALGG
jgi:hypothetical protein